MAIDYNKPVLLYNGKYYRLNIDYEDELHYIVPENSDDSENTGVLFIGDEIRKVNVNYGEKRLRLRLQYKDSG